MQKNGQGLASSNGRACALEIFTSTGGDSNPASTGIFLRGIEIYSIETQLWIFKKCDRIWTRLKERKSKRLYRMGERRKLNKWEPASIFQVTQSCRTGERAQLWIAMPKRHQLCEEIESMGSKKNICHDNITAIPWLQDL